MCLASKDYHRWSARLQTACRPKLMLAYGKLQRLACADHPDLDQAGRCGGACRNGTALLFRHTLAYRKPRLAVYRCADRTRRLARPMGAPWLRDTFGS